MAQEMEAEDTTKFAFKEENTYKLFPVEDVVDTTSRSLAISNKYGYIFAANGQQLLFFKTSQILSEKKDIRTVEIEGVVTQLAVSCDELSIAVCCEGDAFIYNIPSLVRGVVCKQTFKQTTTITN
jgi:hypothetical protein